MTSTEPAKCASEPLTAEQTAFSPCANPFCNTPTTVRTGKRYCSDRCRMDGYALRRAREMLNKVGVVRFFELLQKV